jgi:hypothetical protein
MGEGVRQSVALRKRLWDSSESCGKVIIQPPGGNKMTKILVRNRLFLWFLLFLAPVPAAAQLGPKDAADLPATDIKRVKIGDSAPDFTLQNKDGKSISLSDYRGKNKVVLVFYRGHW